MRYGALGSVHIGAGFVFQRNSFFDAVLRGETREQRHVEIQVHAGGIGVHLGGGVAVFVTRRRIADAQVQRGFVACLGLFNFKLGDVQGHTGLCNAGVQFRRLHHPGVDVSRLWSLQLHGQEQALGFGIAVAHQQVKGHFFDAQIVVRSNFLGQHQVEAGLRFARVSDGGCAHFKIALGRGQLFGYGCFLGLYKSQAVTRSQHIEVSLADAHDQVLFSDFQLR